MTDMVQHQSIVTKVEANVDIERQVLVNILVHASDINNPILPLNMHVKWTDMCMEEFFLQSLKEAELGIPVTPFMSKKDPLSKSGVNFNFLEFVVSPLWTALADIFPEFLERLEIMDSNRSHWKAETERLKLLQQTPPV